MLVVVIDGGESAEEQAGDVRENGSAAWGDTSFGEEIIESSEGVVDALGPLEIEASRVSASRKLTARFCAAW